MCSWRVNYFLIFFWTWNKPSDTQRWTWPFGGCVKLIPACRFPFICSMVFALNQSNPTGIGLIEMNKGCGHIVCDINNIVQIIKEPWTTDTFIVNKLSFTGTRMAYWRTRPYCMFSKIFTMQVLMKIDNGSHSRIFIHFPKIPCTNVGDTKRKDSILLIGSFWNYVFLFVEKQTQFWTHCMLHVLIDQKFFILKKKSSTILSLYLYKLFSNFYIWLSLFHVSCAWHWIRFRKCLENVKVQPSSPMHIVLGQNRAECSKSDSQNSQEKR